jgi:SAM-dependent methyltransferase
MYDGTIDGIDWDAIWDRQMKATSFAGNGVEYWNARARRLPSGAKQDLYVQHMLQRMDVSPESTVLDVGCGAGALTIPLARIARSVTALDQSPAVLEVLAESIAADGISNVSIVDADWPKVNVGADVDVHDVVLASRCLPMGDLRGSLTRMHQAARHLCYLTWTVGDSELQAKACRVLRKPYHPFPDYTIIYNMLRGMDIFANVEIFATHGQRRFADLDQAVSESVRGHEVEDAEGRKRLRAFLATELSRDNGQFIHDFTMRWAVIWWRKRS